MSGERDSSTPADDGFPRGMAGRFSRITCASCGTIIGMALDGGAGGGPAYCVECWERTAEEASARGDGGLDAESGLDDGALHGDGSGAEDGGGGGGDRNGGGGGDSGGDGGEQARRMRSLVRALTDGRDGRPPTRRQVIDAMVLDGGGGAWSGADAAEWCLDNVLGGMLYEPEAGRLSVIGE